MITTITTHQLQLTDQIPIGTVIGAIDVEAGNIEVHCGAFEPQPLDNLRRHHLIQGADIGLKEGIETATEHIIIEVISTDPGANQALNRLVSEELREHVQGAAVKAEAVHYHGDQGFTM